MELLPALGLIMEVFCNRHLKKINPLEMFKACTCEIPIYKIMVFFCCMWVIIAGN